MALHYTIAALISLIVVLIYLSGWFSGAEVALTNLSTLQIAEMKAANEKKVKYVIELKENMDRALITILLGNNIVNIALATVAAVVVNSLFHTLAVTLMAALITFLLVIFGEITPKANALLNTRKICQKRARKILYLMKALRPLIFLFMKVSKKYVGLKEGTGQETHLFVTGETIKGLATMGEEAGAIKPMEKEIIHKVFRFGGKKVEDLNKPDR